MRFVSESQVTVKAEGDVTSPDQPTRVIRPVLAPEGTVTTNFLAVSDTMDASTPPMVTAFTSVRLVPLMVRFDPGAPVSGETFLNVSSCGPTVKVTDSFTGTMT